MKKIVANIRTFFYRNTKFLIIDDAFGWIDIYKIQIIYNVRTEVL